MSTNDIIAAANAKAAKEAQEALEQSTDKDFAKAIAWAHLIIKSGAQPLIASKKDLANPESFTALDFYNEAGQAKGIPVISSEDTRDKGIYNFSCFDQLVEKAKELDSESCLVVPCYVKINVTGTSKDKPKFSLDIATELQSL